MFRKHIVSCGTYRYRFNRIGAVSYGAIPDRKGIAMTVVIWPDDLQDEADVRCIVCEREISVVSATVGPTDGHYDQAFACSRHLGKGESSRFLRAWIDFSLAQYDTENKGDGELWQMSSLSDANSVRM
jgi:hypothetical protein